MKYDKLNANPGVVLREEFDDWAVLFDPDTSESFAVDPVGVFIWKKLDGHRTLEDIMIDLRQTFKQVPEDAREHCMEFLEDLIKRGFAGPEFQKVWSSE